MALMKCPECGSQVSSLAAACPKCGAPVPKPPPKKHSRLAVWILGAVIFGALFRLGTTIEREKANQIAAAREAEAAAARAQAVRKAAPSSPASTARPAAAPPQVDPCSLGDSEIHAYARCAVAIENLATYQAEWTDGWLDGKFDSSRCHDRAALTVMLTGDRVKFQNAFGAWQRMRYSCLWDPRRRLVLDAAALPRSQ